VLLLKISLVQDIGVVRRGNKKRIRKNI